MKEYGSFIELELPDNGHWHTKEKYNMDTVKLNSGRTAIYHAVRVLGVDTVMLPYYQCETVRNFLIKKGINVIYYNIDRNFEPILQENPKNTAMLIVNYYGVMSESRMKRLSSMYNNVIIDNSQAFFANPTENCINVYSARKFVGVPDGAYVVGKNSDRFFESYKQGFSSDTASFLLGRIEYGCEGKVYEQREKNEERIDNEDIMKMSALTEYILNGTDYKNNIEKRKENFKVARRLFDKINKIDISNLTDEKCVPMVYPLLLEDDNLLSRLIAKKHFQGHWWNYVTKETDENSFDNYVSRYMVPITIDQRYDQNDIEYIYSVVVNRN